MEFSNLLGEARFSIFQPSPSPINPHALGHETANSTTNVLEIFVWVHRNYSTLTADIISSNSSLRRRSQSQPAGCGPLLTGPDHNASSRLTPVFCSTAFYGGIVPHVWRGLVCPGHASHRQEQRLLTLHQKLAWCEGIWNFSNCSLVALRTEVSRLRCVLYSCAVCLRLGRCSTIGVSLGAWLWMVLDADALSIAEDRPCCGVLVVILLYCMVYLIIVITISFIPGRFFFPFGRGVSFSSGLLSRGDW